MAFVPAETNAANVTMDLVIAVHRGRLLTPSQSEWAPHQPDIFDTLGEAHHTHYLGTLNDAHCFTAFYNHTVEPTVQHYEWKPLRSLLGCISEEAFQLAGRALQITRWYRDHQYCGACGSKTRDSRSDRARVCTHCEQRFYPRISPCVIGLVTKGDQCLLARGTRTPEGLFTALAGFVEPGETAEQAFAREVKEEVGVSIENIRYQYSQPWPFPGQLMLGFYADYADGNMVLDEREIIEAGWFSRENLPLTPPLGTIAGRLIQGFVKGCAI
ncbi:MAG: NAD(+) diphosphatase [Agarilytica sp.]